MNQLFDVVRGEDVGDLCIDDRERQTEFAERESQGYLVESRRVTVEAPRRL
jgi:hypothetical protein